MSPCPFRKSGFQLQPNAQCTPLSDVIMLCTDRQSTGSHNFLVEANWEGEGFRSSWKGLGGSRSQPGRHRSWLEGPRSWLGGAWRQMGGVQRQQGCIGGTERFPICGSAIGHCALKGHCPKQNCCYGVPCQRSFRPAAITKKHFNWSQLLRY